MLHCEDCLAHYSKGYNHVCPPWLKMLVQAKKNGTYRTDIKMKPLEYGTKIMDPKRMILPPSNGTV